MKSKYYFLFLVFLFSACSASSEPTITPTPTLTPSPMPPTEIPSPLGSVPEFASYDPVVVSGEYAFHVISAEARDLIGIDNTPLSGSRFLIIEGILLNYFDSEQVFYRNQFQLEIAGRTYNPETSRMRQLSEESAYSSMAFPRNEPNLFPESSLILPANSHEEIFLVYELSVPFDDITINFSPDDIEPASRMGLWLITSEDGINFDIYNVRDNDGNNTYEILWDFQVEPPIREEIMLVDPQVLSIDNCDGAGQLSRSRSVTSPSVTPVINFESAASLVGNTAGFLTGNPIIGNIIREALATTAGIQTDVPLSITDTVSATAPPNSRIEAHAVWYTVTKRGVAQASIGGENFYIPYEMIDSLEVQLVSQPVEDCP